MKFSMTIRLQYLAQILLCVYLRAQIVWNFIISIDFKFIHYSTIYTYIHTNVGLCKNIFQTDQVTF